MRKNKNNPPTIIFQAFGKIGNPRAEQVYVKDIKTGKQELVFDKGRTFPSSILNNKYK